MASSAQNLTRAAFLKGVHGQFLSVDTLLEIGKTFDSFGCHSCSSTTSTTGTILKQHVSSFITNFEGFEDYLNQCPLFSMSSKDETLCTATLNKVLGDSSPEEVHKAVFNQGTITTRSAQDTQEYVGFNGKTVRLVPIGSFSDMSQGFHSVNNSSFISWIHDFYKNTSGLPEQHRAGSVELLTNVILLFVPTQKTEENLNKLRNFKWPEGQLALTGRGDDHRNALNRQCCSNCQLTANASNLPSNSIETIQIANDVVNQLVDAVVGNEDDAEMQTSKVSSEHEQHGNMNGQSTPVTGDAFDLSVNDSISKTTAQTPDNERKIDIATPIDKPVKTPSSSFEQKENPVGVSDTAGSSGVPAISQTCELVTPENNASSSKKDGTRKRVLPIHDEEDIEVEDNFPNDAEDNVEDNGSLPLIHSFDRVYKGALRSSVTLTPSMYEKLRTELLKRNQSYTILCLLDFAKSQRTNFTDAEIRVVKFIEEQKEKALQEEPCTEVAKNLQENGCRHLEFQEYLQNMVTASIDDNQPEKVPQKYSIAPKLSFIGSLKLPLNVSSAEVLQKASLFATENRWLVYSSKNFTHFEIKKESRGVKRMKSGAKVSTAPFDVVVFSKMSLQEMNSEIFNESLMKHDCVLVKDAVSILGMDEKLFSLEALQKAKPDLTFPVHINFPQPPGTNCTEAGKPVFESSEIKLENVNIEKFGKEYNTLKNLGKEMFDVLTDDADISKAIEEKLTKKLMRNNVFLDWSEETNDKLFYTAFGTNVDLSVGFSEQLNELKCKVPSFLSHENKGTILDFDVVGHHLEGINSPQLYLKCPGSQTNGHVENGRFTSVNINFGPGDSVWYCVPPEYLGELEKLMNNLHKWPTMRLLRKYGIPVSKTIQKPGDLMYINVGTYHYVTSTGFCSQVAWNVAPATFDQLSSTIVNQAHDETPKRSHPCHFPLVSTFWNVAKFGWYKDKREVLELIRRVLIRSLAHSKAMKDVLEKRGFEVSNRNSLENYELPPFVICDACKREVTGVVHIFKSLSKAQESCFCIYCKQPQSNHGRSVYAEVISIDEMAQILDRYN